MTPFFFVKEERIAIKKNDTGSQKRELHYYIEYCRERVM